MNEALHQMLLRSGELDQQIERGPAYTTAKWLNGPPGPPPPPFVIPPADWEAEARERAARERAEREAALPSELAKLLESEAAEPPAKPTPPAPRQHKPWRRTPS